MSDQELTAYREHVTQELVSAILPPELVKLFFLFLARINELEQEVTYLKHQASLDSRTSSKKEIYTSVEQKLRENDPNYFQEKLIPYPILDSRSRKGYELIWKKASR